jgi:hypothetical protein
MHRVGADNKKNAVKIMFTNFALNAFITPESRPQNSGVSWNTVCMSLLQPVQSVQLHMKFSIFTASFLIKVA